MARILVADDERSICDAFRLLLEAQGDTALVASTGEEALLLAREQLPDLAFVDVRMPGMGGLEVLKELGRVAPALPVVIMTAYGTLDTAAEAVRNKAFDYLGKPLARDLPRRLQLCALRLARGRRLCGPVLWSAALPCADRCTTLIQAR